MEKSPQSQRDDDIVVVAARRTPMGSFLGSLASLTATDLGGAAIAALTAEIGMPLSEVDEVFMGCVLSAGLGQAPARQAALKAGLPLTVGCTTINKVCGSAMKAVMLGHDLIRAGSAEVVIAGGMESMSNAPYLVAKGRSGYRMGHGQLLDHLFFDGLENAEDHQLMGQFAEQCARHYGFTRERQDRFAISSVERALAAIEQGAFKNELATVTVGRDGAEMSQDEQPFKCKIEKILHLKPAFDRENGTVTAANASSISDGAAALLLMRRHKARQYQLTPLATLIAHASHGQAPDEFTTAPIGAIEKLYANAGWASDDVDLFEINEAFAVVTLAAMEELRLNADKVNVNGGACALGHPIGATGARLLVTLIHALRQRKLKRGIAALCIGGGEATAMAVEVDD